MSIKAFVRTAGVLAVAATTAACNTADPIQVSGLPDDYRTRHPIILSEKEQTLDVPIASGQRELNIPVKSNIRAFASAFASAGTGSLYLMMPTGSPNAHAVDFVRPQIIQAIADGGAARGRVIVQHYDAGAYGPAAPVRLSYNAVAASTAPCGNWPADLSKTAENRHYYNYGCATQSNLAAIIANPVDLMGPRETSQIDAIQRAAVIEGYQSGPRGAASEVAY
ncbi:CpaD family pilus assembly protein [Oricola cellulosilytica]|uniref:Pilus assembly protein CpaD n=1 Tax=Oricola cellulosilytica TaxID=1429082 RepID=A0A4R0PHZ6_9HYPH|nr:CpaD family pilus assembly lipoprotein [Oricola cellulosilytica]TCD16423.1 pilus assembly protein CpaD [Oricola cellulosilytica]